MNSTSTAIAIGFWSVLTGQPQSWEGASAMDVSWQLFDSEFQVNSGLPAPDVQTLYRLEVIEEDIFYRALRRSARLVSRGNRLA